MHTAKKWLRPVGSGLGAAASLATVLVTLHTFGVPSLSAAVRVAGPYVAILVVGVVILLVLRRYTDRRIAELRAEIQKAQADAEIALDVLRNPVGLRVLLDRSQLPSGVIVDVEKNFENKEALRLARRLKIVKPQDVRDGSVWWVWQYGGEKPDEKSTDAPALALAMTGDPFRPF